MNVGTPEFFPDGGPIVIRDTAWSFVKTITGFKNVWRQRAIPEKPDQVPLASVWCPGEQTEPWGDANSGVPRFRHTMRLIVDIVTTATAVDDLDPAIVALVDAVRARLLTDPAFVNLVESIERCDTVYSYPGEGSALYARGVIELELVFHSEWAPVVVNDFVEAGFTVGPDSATAFHQSVTLEAST